MKYNNLDFNGKTILITGGAGFIGSNLALYFQINFPASNIVIFDCFRNGEVLDNGNLKSFGHYDNLLGFKGHIICGDINNKDDLEVLNNFSFDYIFHHAAISDTRVNDQEIIIRTNVNSFYNILNLAKINKSILVYASSAAVYGSLNAPQCIGNEKPDSPYGFSKYMMDQIASNYSKKNLKMTIVGLRFFNVYGPKEYLKETTASMVIQLGIQLLSGKSPRLFENSEQIFRDFIHIDDVVKANIMACNSEKNGVFNIGLGKSRSFKDISDILQHGLGTNLEVDYFPNPYKSYQMNTMADLTLSKESLGFDPKISLEKGIKSYVPEIKRIYNLIKDD
jgi:ADP-L-glycero-D-manno-heptose 6-epimerase